MQVKSYVERIIICLNEDGTLRGAHQETLHQIIQDDGTPLPGGGSMEPASSVDAETLANFLDAGTLVAQVSQLQTLLSEKDSRIAELQIQINNVSNG